MKALDEILKEYFGCNKPFLKNPTIECIDYDGEKHYNYFTKTGSRAYSQLIGLIYDLESLGVLHGANGIIEKLDEIVRE